ncbi:MAG: cytochrome oxidase putative small subunit CydP [Undibacterium curvum]|uniref:cytochrome oxidase putative small subunit CydP n=1 Tax=Undibacterium curvum TaxID=2762294 RepID=UPI003BDDCD69
MPTPSASGIQAQQAGRLLKRELIIVLLIKLVLLFSIKAVFFPQKLSGTALNTGIAVRLGGSSAQEMPLYSGGNETEAKEKQ